jgi:hypothetical protein
MNSIRPNGFGSLQPTLAEPAQSAYPLDDFLRSSIRRLVSCRPPVARKFENLRAAWVEYLRHRGASARRPIRRHHRAARGSIRHPVIEVPLHHHKVHMMIRAMVIQLLEQQAAIQLRCLNFYPDRGLTHSEMSEAETANYEKGSSS